MPRGRWEAESAPWVSQQSRPLASRAELIDAVAHSKGSSRASIRRARAIGPDTALSRSRSNSGRTAVPASRPHLFRPRNHGHALEKDAALSVRARMGDSLIAGSQYRADQLGIILAAP